jgi:hypothetical protein
LLQLDTPERGVGVGAPVARVGCRDVLWDGVSGDVHPSIAQIAAEIGTPVEAVARRLVTVVDDRPMVRWRSGNPSLARRQIEATLIYIYTLKKLGEVGARIWRGSRWIVCFRPHNP